MQASGTSKFEHCLKRSDQAENKSNLWNVSTIPDINAIIDSNDRMDHASPEADKILLLSINLVICINIQQLLLW